MPSNIVPSNIDIAELILANAIARTSQLTGLNRQEALALLTSQANLSNQPQLASNSSLLNSNESQFIASLFH